MNYLRDNPKAKDTLQGVAKWWVGDEEKVVNEALIFLQNEGVIEKRGQLYQLMQIATGEANTAGLERMLRRLTKNNT